MSHILAVALGLKTDVDAVFEELGHGLVVIRKDLRLLSSLYIAHFIVWRELRRTNRQKSVPHKGGN
jgi:hypothetical protein